MTSNSIYTCLTIRLFYGMQSTDLCNAFEAITYIANGLLQMFNVHFISTDTELEFASF